MRYLAYYKIVYWNQVFKKLSAQAVIYTLNLKTHKINTSIIKFAENQEWPVAKCT